VFSNTQWHRPFARFLKCSSVFIDSLGMPWVLANYLEFLRDHSSWFCVCRLLSRCTESFVISRVVSISRLKRVSTKVVSWWKSVHISQIQDVGSFSWAAFCKNKISQRAHHRSHFVLEKPTIACFLLGPLRFSTLWRGNFDATLMAYAYKKVSGLFMFRKVLRSKPNRKTNTTNLFFVALRCPKTYFPQRVDHITPKRTNPKYHQVYAKPHCICQQKMNPHTYIYIYIIRWCRHVTASTHI